MNILTYLIEDAITGLIKIGKSTNPNERRKALQCGSSNKLSLIRVFDANIEHLLHCTFAHKKVHGEWFSVSKDEVVSFVETLDLSLHQDSGKSITKVKSQEIFNKVKEFYFPRQEENIYDFDAPYYDLPSFTDMRIRREYNMIYMIIFDNPPETIRILNRIHDFNAIPPIFSDDLHAVFRALEVANAVYIEDKVDFKTRKKLLRDAFNRKSNTKILKEIAELTTP